MRKLILDRLKELNLTMGEASRLIGKNAAYMQQFLKRGIPVELHERDRIKLAELLKVPEDELRGASVTLPSRTYEKTPASRKSLIDRESHLPYASEKSAPAKIVPAADLFSGNIDLPVYGTAPSGQDGAIVTKHAVDWTVRPPSLLRVQDGYGLIVPDNTMSPEHKAGSIALVNPHLPPKFGESCVLRCLIEDGSELVVIREYRGETDTAWKVTQHEPPKHFTLKKSAWTCQRTVGNYFA